MKKFKLGEICIGLIDKWGGIKEVEISVQKYKGFVYVDRV